MSAFVIIIFILWAITIPLAWRAERAYLRLDELKIVNDEDNLLPSLSIIIPARNEAQVLPWLLNSLKDQAYSSFLEIIVVDDNSQDETSEIAKSVGVKVIEPAELPSGWLGKPHACHRGAKSALGEWLLFTDADTI